MTHPLPRRPRRRPCAPDHDLAELLRLAAGGDAAAFMRFYDATIRVVHGYARLRYDDPAAVDDAVRSLYWRAWRSAARYSGSGLSVRAWLLRHAEHRAQPPGSAA